MMKDIATNVKDIADNLPSAEDIIRALGLQTRSSRTETLPGLALFGAGLLVGAGLALLFAPTTGEELRHGIGEQVSELRGRVVGNGQHEGAGAQS